MAGTVVQHIQHLDDSMPPRLAELIEDYGFLSSAVTAYVLELLTDAGDVAQFARLFPSLFTELDEDAWTDPEMDFELLDELISDLENLEPGTLRELGFVDVGPVINVQRGDRYHNVTLGIATTSVQDWWWVCLDSNVGGEYYSHVDGPRPISLENRRRAITAFLDVADNWIGNPVLIHTWLGGPDADWLDEVQGLPVERADPPERALDPASSDE